MSELLFEIFSEEIPAKMQLDAISDLNKMFADMFGQEQLGYKNIRGFVSPRRMSVIVNGLDERRNDITEERKGPSVAADAKAVEGFLKTTGLKLEQLEKRDTPKGVFYFACLNKKGNPTSEILLEKIPDIMKRFPWPKPMRWAKEKDVWIRPIHGMICILDGKVIPVRYASVEASDYTYGHRFMAPGKIIVKDFSDYEKKLREAFVEIDQEKRKEEISKQCLEIAKQKGVQLKEDKGLLEEVTGLCEYTRAVIGNIREEFMSVPKECLISSMRNHQKYFSLLNMDGSLAPYFITVSNMKMTLKNESNIKTGNEKVLKARLSDAKFFWETDRKTTLESRVASLEKRIFHADIGSMKKKVDRCMSLSVHIAGLIGADKRKAERAALLCKADLSSGMVGEFPELQGIMGRYYALNDGEDKEVAWAIEEHYLPLGPSDSVPKNPISICTALADKVDSLVAFWLIGQKPSGSKDPFALRRAALGVIRIIIENKLRLHLKEIFSVAKNNFSNLHGDVEEDLLRFFAERLKVYLKTHDVRHDYISAVFGDSKEDDVTIVIEKIKALEKFFESDDGKNLLAAYKRSANILRIESSKDKKNYDDNVDEKLFDSTSEIELYQEIQKVRKDVGKFIAEENFTEAMIVLAKLRKFVDNFFTNVVVNYDDSKIRINRLKMLGLIVSTSNVIADFSQVET